MSQKSINVDDERILTALRVGTIKKEDLVKSIEFSEKRLRNALERLQRKKLVKRAKKGYYRLTAKGREQTGGKPSREVTVTRKAKEPEIKEPAPESKDLSQEIKRLLKSEELEPESDKSETEPLKAQSAGEFWADILLKGMDKVVGEVKKYLSPGKFKKQKEPKEEKDPSPEDIAKEINEPEKEEYNGRDWERDKSEFK